MEKVLQISMGETFGGIEKMEFEWFKHIDDKIKFDFITPIGLTFSDYENEIKKLGGNVYNLSISRKTKKGKIIYAYRLYKFLKNNKYKIIHINSGAFFFSLQVALIAKMCKVKKVIVHSHNSYPINKLKKLLIKILNPLLKSLTDGYLTCSKQATKSLFTKTEDVIVLKNGIDIEKYKYNKNIRNEYRKLLCVENKIVYGHIGRFETQKNHDLLIDIFYELQKKQNNAVLLLIGEGPLEQMIKEKVHNLNIENKVIFLGFRDDINLLLNSMDIFIFPSLYEGLGIVLIEAQTNGLITYCSENIPDEANISLNFKTFDLNESSHNIADYICNMNINLDSRKEAYRDTIKAGYDIEKVIKELEKIYVKLLKEVKNG